MPKGPVIERIEFVVFELSLENMTTDPAGLGIAYATGRTGTHVRFGLRIYTDSGVVGKYVPGRGRAKVIKSASEALAHSLVGHPALQRERHYRNMRREDRVGFAEFHAAGSKSGMFMLRDGDWKLIYYVGMPPQLFDVKHDPEKRFDLGAGHPKVKLLEARLREICDPEAIDAQAKADQRARIEHWGGREAILAEGALVYTPPPGGVAEIQH